MSEDQNLSEEVEAVDAVPEWVPEKFRSNPEEFAKAYTNLEREFHASRQEKKGLEDSLQELSSRFEEFTAAQNQPDPNTVYAQWQEAFEADPIGTIAQIAQTSAQQVHQQYAQQSKGPSTSPEVVAFIADQTMTRDHDDWDEYKEKVGQLIASDPLFQRDDLYASPELTTKALNSAYQMVKAQDVLSGAAVVQQQVDTNRAMKLNAQSAVGASGRPPAPSDDEWARIKAAGDNPYWA